MLRRKSRLQREYLFRKFVENKKRAIENKRHKIQKSLDQCEHLSPTLLRQTADELSKESAWKDKGPEAANLLGTETGGTSGAHADYEYHWAGVEDPKIMITTSRDPSSRLKMFMKELRLILPNAQRMNRGAYEIKQLIHACRANNVTDFIIVHESRGNPDGLVICHLPYGPTAYFTLSNVVMRHDIPDIGTMSEANPHLIFHNFTTELGLGVQSIFKYLFPVPKEDSKRIITFANHDDHIAFRHHLCKKVDGKNVELEEVGPRFQLKLFKIILGTLDSAAVADIEWVLRPYMNTAGKRRFLSEQEGWVQEDDIVV